MPSVVMDIIDERRCSTSTDKAEAERATLAGLQEKYLGTEATQFFRSPAAINYAAPNVRSQRDRMDRIRKMATLVGSATRGTSRFGRRMVKIRSASLDLVCR